jgi:hypothetical protein
MLHTGIRGEDTEQVASQLCGLNDQGYRQRTATAGIGYLLPGRSWCEREITPCNPTNGSLSWTFDPLNTLTCGFTSQVDEICALK